MRRESYDLCEADAVMVAVGAAVIVIAGLVAALVLTIALFWFG